MLCLLIKVLNNHVNLPECKISINVSSVSNATTHFLIKCRNPICRLHLHQYKWSPVQDAFNFAFYTALESTGITTTQISNLLGALNFGVRNEKNKLYGMSFGTPGSRSMRRQVQQSIIELSENEQAQHREDLNESNETDRIVSLDGTQCSPNFQRFRP